MKKQAGFTLAELIVSMGIFVLIIGAIAALFGTSLKAMVYGKNQERAYAEARNVMNDLKTTLRYANKKNTIIPSLTSTSVDYGGTMIINNDPSNTNSKDYTRNISFNSEKNQLEIIWTGFYPGESATSGTKTIYFPAKGNEKDSAFNTDEYRKACQDMFTDTSTIVSGIPFPIFRGTYEGKEVFNIVLPIQYAFEGGKKVEILRSRVAAENYEEESSSAAINMPDRLVAAIKSVYETEGKTVGRIDSGASLGGKELAGFTGKVIKQLQGSGTYEDKDNPFNDLSLHSWTIQSCDANGNLVKKNVTYWIIYVAKNVEDDTYYDEENKKYITGYYADNDLFKTMAQDYGRYIIRENWAFIVYCAVYDTTGARVTDTSILKKLGSNVDASGNKIGRVPLETNTIGNYGYGYAAGVKRTGYIVINAENWNPNYKKSSGSLYWSNRIDYDKTGNEYTRLTAGSGYEYPPK